MGKRRGGEGGRQGADCSRFGVSFFLLQELGERERERERERESERESVCV